MLVGAPNLEVLHRLRNLWDRNQYRFEIVFYNALDIYENFEKVEQLTRGLWANKISQDLNSRWVSGGIAFYVFISKAPDEFS